MANRTKQLRKLARTVIKDEILKEKEQLEKEVKELREKVKNAENDEELERVKDKVSKLEKELKEAKEDSLDLDDLFTKSDLKAILESRDEKTTGTKDELVKRVKNG